MNIMLPKALVIELLTKPEQEKNETTGKYVNTGNTKHVLVTYPFGQDITFRAAGCINVAIDPVRLKDIQPHIGKLVMLELDQEITKSGAQFHTFVDVHQLPASKAA